MTSTILWDLCVVKLIY